MVLTDAQVSRRLEELRAPSTTSAVTATHVVPQNYVTSHDPVMTSHNPGMASAGLLPGPAVGMGEPREQLQDPTMAGGGVVEPLPHLQRSGNKFDDLYEKVKKTRSLSDVVVIHFQQLSRSFSIATASFQMGENASPNAGFAGH